MKAVLLWRTYYIVIILQSAWILSMVVLFTQPLTPQKFKHMLMHMRRVKFLPKCL